VATRVLIVEDERHIIESLSFVLESEGFTVDSELDGEAARSRRMSWCST
jgi:DNA-binding response OmpR family regulator